MKKIFSIFLFLGAFLFFTACSKDASINEVPKVQLNIYLSQSARSASLLPEYDFSQETYTFKLIANSNSGECFEWGLTFNSGDKSFTSAQDNSILLNQGTWSFTLSVYHDNNLCLVGKNEDVEISEDNNTLSFTLSQANEGDIALGFIDVTINFPPSAGVTKVCAYLIDNDGSKIEFLNESDAENKIITSDGNNTVTYKYSLASGNYILSFDFYQNETKIANYMLPVLIASGATSYYNGGDETSLTLTIDNFNTIYTLTLIVDETFYRYSYTKNQNLILPTLEKEGFNFEGWVKNGDENETPVSEIPSGSISGDVTYTAKFTENAATETEIQLTSSSSPLSTGTYYVEDSMTIEDPIEISGDVVIYAKNDSTITSYSGVFSLNDGASLTLGKEDAGLLTITNINGYMAAIRTTANNNNNITINDNVTFTGCENSYQISFISSGNLIINGGDFVENQYTPLYVNNSSATLTINGGNISNNSIPSGNYAINVQAGSLAITGGTIRDNYVNGTNHGASIYVKNTEGNSFTISNESQTMGSEFTNNIVDGNIVESTSGEEKSITYAGTDTTSSFPIFYIYDANGLETFRKIVNGTLLDDTTTSYTIKADDSVTGIADYSITTNENYSNIVGSLKSDIDLTNIEWQPIGTADTPFIGDFYGNDYTVSNLTISNTSEDNQGLFGYIDASARGSSSVIKSITVSGNITSSNANVGGLVGNANNVNFTNCVNNVNITTSSSEAGGIAGMAKNSTFTSCVNLADIKSTSDSIYLNLCVGGIAGYITDVNADYCYNAGAISANLAVGGIFGYEYGSTSSYPTIDYCINTGDITGLSYFGGILGYANKALSIGYCVNYGEIVSLGSNTFGCIVGSCNSNNTTQVTECLALGRVTTEGSFYAVSENAGVTDSHYDSDVLSPKGISSNGGGSGLATSVLTSGASLDDYLLYGDWYYQNGSYPIPEVEENLSSFWDDIVSAATPTSTVSN